jgi:hypothetical protein
MEVDCLHGGAISIQQRNRLEPAPLCSDRNNEDDIANVSERISCESAAIS